MIKIAETAKASLPFDLQMFANGDIGGGAGDPAAGGASGGDPAGKAGANGQENGGGSDEKIYSEKHVKKVTDENASYRHKIKEYEAKEKAREEAEAAAATKKLEEDGELKKALEAERKRADKVVADAEKKVQATQRRAIRESAKAQLIAEGILDVDDVDLLDLAKAEWDNEADEPKNVSEIVAAFKKAKPAKFKAADDGGNGNNNGSNNGRRAKVVTPSGGGNNNGKGDDANNWTKEEMATNWGTIRL